MSRRNPRSIFQICTVALIAGAVVWRIWFPLTPYFDWLPQLDIRAFSPSLLAGLGYGLLLIALFVILVIAQQQISKLSEPPKFRFIFLVTLLLGVVLLNTYPINATDVYRYLIRGRVNSIYGQNQYEVPPAHFPNDPFAEFAGEWAGETSPYGPVWELMATAVTAQTQDNLLAGLLTFKTIALFAHLGSTTLIWLLLAQRTAQQRAGLTLLWAWNPVLMLTFVVNAHNDALMLCLMLLGYWLSQKHSKIIGTLVFVIAVLTKPIALLALPLFFAAAWHTYPEFAQKVRFAISVGLGTVILGWLAFLPFGSPLDLFFRLVRESSAGGGFSLPVIIVLLNNLLGGAVHARYVLIAGQALFGVVALWLFWRTLNGRSPLRSVTDIFAAYILQAFNFRLWYATWLFPWALVDEDGGEDGRLSSRTQITLLFLLTSQLSALIYGHLRVYALGGSQLWAHLIGVPFTFALPFILPKLIKLATKTIHH